MNANELTQRNSSARKTAIGSLMMIQAEDRHQVEGRAPSGRVLSPRPPLHIAAVWPLAALVK